jgi:hypothetical protein
MSSHQELGAEQSEEASTAASTPTLTVRMESIGTPTAPDGGDATNQRAQPIPDAGCEEGAD